MSAVAGSSLGMAGGRPSDAGHTAVPRRAWQVLAVTAAGVFIVFLDATVVNIAFPAISEDFTGVSRAGLSWILNAYAVVFGALLLTAGRLADDHGRRRMFVTGLIAFAAASVLCGLAPNVPLLVAARALQAIGAALVVPASLALLLPEFPASRRAGVVGLWGAAGALAAAIGPTLGALLVEGPGWRWIFFVNAPIVTVAVVAGRRVLRESSAEGTRGRPDFLGVLLVTAVFGLLSLALVEGGSWGWGSPRIVGSFVAAAVLLPLLVLRSLRHANPVLPVRLFGNATFSLATAGLLLFGAAFFAIILANVLFLTGVWQYSVLRAAVALLPSPLLAAVSAPIAGRLADRFGFRVVIAPGALCMVGGTLWLATRTTAEPAYVAHFLPGSVLVGLSIGFAFAALGAAGASALGPREFGSGSAVGASARQLGAVLGVAVLVAVLGEPAPAGALAAFHRSWLVIAAFAAASVVVSLGLRRSPAQPGLATRPGAAG